MHRNYQNKYYTSSNLENLTMYRSVLEFCMRSDFPHARPIFQHGGAPPMAGRSPDSGASIPPAPSPVRGRRGRSRSREMTGNRKNPSSQRSRERGAVSLPGTKNGRRRSRQGSRNVFSILLNLISIKWMMGSIIILLIFVSRIFLKFVSEFSLMFRKLLIYNELLFESCE